MMYDRMAQRGTRDVAQVTEVDTNTNFIPLYPQKTNTMENNNVNNLIEEGKKQLAALQVELTKLADVAEKVVGVKAEEVSKQAEVLIGEAKTKIEEKTKRASLLRMSLRISNQRAKKRSKK
jgi:phenylalanyl-tRNA synthetase alpha subunit